MALKMAQILEEQNILVTVSLLEGDPDSLVKWNVDGLLSNKNFINKLNTKYNLLSHEVMTDCVNHKI